MLHRAILGIALILAASNLSALAAEFFVAPNGTAAGNGSMSQPWDLQTALDQPSDVKPGDTIWLRGGTYGKGGPTLFTARLRGTQDQPIVVRQYRRERAVVDGGIAAPAATWATFWGFEITNSSPLRKCSPAQRPFGLNLQARGCKAINLVVHDTGHPGIGFWVGVGDGGEIYGCIFWAVGLYDTQNHPELKGWTRGSAIYTQNRPGTRYITDTIAFRCFTEAVHAYTEGGYVEGYDMEGNIWFDNGEWNLIATGGKNPAKRIKVTDNYTYRRRTDPARSVRFGYGSAGEDLVCRNNYFVSGTADEGTVFVRRFSDATVSGNTLVSGNVLAQIGGAVGVRWDENRYFGPASKAFRPNEKPATDFATWKQAGFDANSTLESAYPSGVKVFVRPNKYEPGRAHVAVYNWDHQDAVALDLGAALKEGDKFEIRDVQNYFGPPLVAGTYEGKPVSVSMKLTEVAGPVGDVPHIAARFQHTAPEFAAFVVLPRD